MRMKEQPNVLVVCGRNKRRSRTAEFIFKNDMRFNIRSVGLSPQSPRQLKEQDMLWADLTLVMDNSQKKRISTMYRHLDFAAIEILHIPDEYGYQDHELIELLKHKINASLQLNFNL